MKPTKLRLLTTLIASFFAIISIQMAAPEPEVTYDQSAFERFPPVPTQFWVQKLVTPLSDSSNMIIRIKYVSDTVLPSSITMYINGGNTIFHDDGTGPDSVSGDGVYAAYLKENITSFLTSVQSLHDNLATKGSFTTFTGHFGQVNTTTPIFDVENFNNNHQVEFDQKLINGVDCGNNILRQNSLFITDLSVVEDEARTYRVSDGTGTITGVWTFGNLIKNIVNSAHYGDNNYGEVRTFLKQWVGSYMVSRTLNGQSTLGRTDIYTFLIEPWLRKANASNPSYTSHGQNNWQTDWDQTDETSLVQNAPFKLMAIVNRLDLRGNSYYSSSMGLSGETRFIYTLIAPVQIYKS